MNFAFLGAFVVTSIVAWVAMAARRRAIRRGSGEVRGLHPYELAYLRGGDRLTLSAVLGALRVGQVIGPVPPGTRGMIHPAEQHYMQVTGSARHPLTPLDEAVVEACREHSRDYGFRFGHVASDHRVRQALAGLRQQLERAGLVLGRAERRRLRLTVLPLLVPSGVCALWFAAVMSMTPGDQRPIWATLAALFGQILFVVALVGLMHPPVTTLAGAKAVSNAERRRPTAANSDPYGTALKIALGMQQVTGIERTFGYAAQIIRKSSGD